MCVLLRHWQYFLCIWHCFLQFGEIELPGFLTRALVILLFEPPPCISAEATTLREGIVTFGIADFPSARGWDADRFSTLVGVPWPGLVVQASNTSPAPFITPSIFWSLASLRHPLHATIALDSGAPIPTFMASPFCIPRRHSMHATQSSPHPTFPPSAGSGSPHSIRSTYAMFPFIWMLFLQSLVEQSNIEISLTSRSFGVDRN